MNFVFTISFFLYLLRIDQYIANKTGDALCPVCGGRLDIRNWYRKGFGVPPGCGGTSLIRHSFCCSCCRTTVTPNSLRFMYYKRNAICSWGSYKGVAQNVQINFFASLNHFKLLSAGMEAKASATQEHGGPPQGILKA